MATRPGAGAGAPAPRARGARGGAEAAPVPVRRHERGELPAHGLEEAVNVPGLGLDVVALLVLGVLGGDADDALPDGALEARDAAAGDDRGRPHGDRVRAEGDRLRRVAAVPDPP